MEKPKVVACMFIYMIMLIGCSSNNSKKSKLDEYKKSLKYTFNDKYTIEYKYEDDSSQTWEISFIDKNSNLQKEELNFYEFTDLLKEVYGNNQQQCDDDSMHNMYAAFIRAIANRELYDKILSKYFDYEYTEEKNDVIFYGDDYAITVSFVNVTDAYTNKAYEQVKKDLSPQNGIKLSEIDLKSIAADDANVLTLNLMLNRGADKQQFIRKITSINEDIDKYVPQIRNYDILLTVKTADGHDTLYRKSKMFGIFINADEHEARYKGCGNYIYSREVYLHLYNE